MTRCPIVFRKPIVFDQSFNCPYSKPFGYIYKVTNLINGHMYIGKHKFNKPYIDSHYKGSGSALLDAYNKYGIDNFEIIVLQWTDGNSNDLSELEKFWIRIFHSFVDEEHYNLTPGGDGGYMSEERRQIMSKMNKGSNNPMYNKGYLVAGKRNGRYNKPVSDTTRTKISESVKDSYTEQRKKHLSELASKRIGDKNPNYNNHWSSQQRKRQSNLVSNRMNKPEVKKKLSKFASTRTSEKNPNYGNYWTDEQKCSSKNSRPIVQLTLNYELVREYGCITLVRNFGFNPFCVGDCCRGKQKSSKGYLWMYKEDYERICCT